MKIVEILGCVNSGLIISMYEPAFNTVSLAFFGNNLQSSQANIRKLFGYLKYTAFFPCFQNVTEISENTRLSVVGFNQVTLKASGHVRLNFLFLFSALVFYLLLKSCPYLV